MACLSLRKLITGMIVLIVLLFCANLPAAQADRGIIPPEPVQVDEPGQTAFIAFNGREELLLLGTDVKAARAGAAIQFIPFPSPPRVEPAPEGAFVRLAGLLAAHQVFYRGGGRGPGPPAAGPGEGEPVRVVSHQRIGLHDVTVVEVKDAARFAAWVKDCFRKQGWPARELTGKEKTIVADYCRRGFNYFVIDRVEIEEAVRSVPPLIFRFNTPALYYPFKVTNLFGGEGEAQLIVCGGERLFARLPALLASVLSSGRWKESSRAFIDPQELAHVAPGVEKLFSGKQELGAFRYRGELSFRGDLWVDPAAPILRVDGRACPGAALRWEKGEWLVPARGVFAGLNAKVTWDAKRREAVVTASGLVGGLPRDPAAKKLWAACGATLHVHTFYIDKPIEIRFPVDPQSVSFYDPAVKKTGQCSCYLVYVNGCRYVLCDPAAGGGRALPRLVDGRFYLPASVFADLLGAGVAWDDGRGELRIDGLRFLRRGEQQAGGKR